jgi:hypothetical protein
MTKPGEKMYINYRRSPIYIIVLAVIISTILWGCSSPGKRKEVPKIEMVVDNPLQLKRTDEFVVLKVADLKSVAPDFSQDTFIVLQSGSNQEIPHQLDDMNNDGEGDEIAMVMDMEPGEKKNIEIRYAPAGTPGTRPVTLGYKKRTRATIDPEYEGLLWESELIKYSLYIDERNSISVFCKEFPGLSFATVENSTDILIPGGTKILDGDYSVGCGGFGIWYENKLIKPMNTNNLRVYPRIVADGPIRSAVQVIFESWRIGNQNLRVIATYSIFAGQQWTRVQVKTEGASIPVKIATGLTKSAAAKLTKDESNSLFYTWQTSSDNLGMGLIYSKDSFESFREDNGSYLVVLNPNAEKEAIYWSLASWNRGDTGIKDEKQFADLSASIAQRLKTPLTVTIMPVKPRQTKESTKENKGK